MAMATNSPDPKKIYQIRKAIADMKAPKAAGENATPAAESAELSEQQLPESASVETIGASPADYSGHTFSFSDGASEATPATAVPEQPLPERAAAIVQPPAATAPSSLPEHGAVEAAAVTLSPSAADRARQAYVQAQTAKAAAESAPGTISTPERAMKQTAQGENLENLFPGYRAPSHYMQAFADRGTSSGSNTTQSALPSAAVLARERGRAKARTDAQTDKENTQADAAHSAQAAASEASAPTSDAPSSLGGVVPYILAQEALQSARRVGANAAKSLAPSQTEQETTEAEATDSLQRSGRKALHTAGNTAKRFGRKALEKSGFATGTTSEATKVATERGRAFFREKAAKAAAQAAATGGKAAAGAAGTASTAGAAGAAGAAGTTAAAGTTTTTAAVAFGEGTGGWGFLVEAIIAIVAIVLVVLILVGVFFIAILGGALGGTADYMTYLLPGAALEVENTHIQRLCAYQTQYPGYELTLSGDTVDWSAILAAAMCTSGVNVADYDTTQDAVTACVIAVYQKLVQTSISLNNGAKTGTVTVTQVASDATASTLGISEATYEAYLSSDVIANAVAGLSPASCWEPYISTGILTDTTMCNAADLAAWAEYLYRSGWNYMTASYGNVLTIEEYARMVALYPSIAVSDTSALYQGMLGNRTVDTCGLITSYLWLNTSTHTITPTALTGITSSAMARVTANALYNAASVRGDISTLPETPGVAVYANGRVGVYIGNGYVIEAVASYNGQSGVIRTTVAARNWTNWFYVPGVTYPDEEDSQDTTDYIDYSDWVDYTTKNNLDFVSWAEFAYEHNWGYVWGTFGNVLTESLLQQKISQYPTQVGNYEAFIRANWLGGRTVDCVGLIKSYFWFDPEEQTFAYASNGMPDYAADQIIACCTESGTMDTMPEIPGIIVWRSGHVGIYIGDGYVIQAAGTYSGVLRSALNTNYWTMWGKLPCLTYLD